MAKSSKKGTSSNSFEDFEKSNNLIQLTRIANLLALSAIKELEQKDQVIFLSKAGFSYQQISSLIGSTPDAVRKLISRNTKNRKS